MSNTNTRFRPLRFNNNRKTSRSHKGSPVSLDYFDEAINQEEHGDRWLLTDLAKALRFYQKSFEYYTILNSRPSTQNANEQNSYYNASRLLYNVYTEFVKPNCINYQKDLKDIQLMLSSDNSVLKPSLKYVLLYHENAIQKLNKAGDAIIIGDALPWDLIYNTCLIYNELIEEFEFDELNYNTNSEKFTEMLDYITKSIELVVHLLNYQMNELSVFLNNINNNQGDIDITEDNNNQNNIAADEFISQDTITLETTLETINLGYLFIINSYDNILNLLLNPVNKAGIFDTKSILLKIDQFTHFNDLKFSEINNYYNRLNNNNNNNNNDDDDDNGSQLTEKLEDDQINEVLINKSVLSSIQILLKYINLNNDYYFDRNLIEGIISTWKNDILDNEKFKTNSDRYSIFSDLLMNYILPFQLEEDKLEALQLINLNYKINQDIYYQSYLKLNKLNVNRLKFDDFKLKFNLLIKILDINLIRSDNEISKLLLTKKHNLTKHENENENDEVTLNNVKIFLKNNLNLITNYKNCNQLRQIKIFEYKLQKIKLQTLVRSCLLSSSANMSTKTSLDVQVHHTIFGDSVEIDAFYLSVIAEELQRLYENDINYLTFRK
ncbi:uncharacterized protein ASCRUDRAFT_8606 [Ascoidea rubescens DSM 1968]|uniref:Uncharacterized protein n=1 Tax=Ascoidea rubescens DSM 1968 TaxID=1344418 RepID=A0A1D2VFB0_9ASCO|nr:hypothetical protein ASCRUDRAFT_8606 [Ascoidea rubescens DSM 1968]ODV60368.1 hypothetical protein ASCRUDRAFT_8606 [Ascoidea rubescens DSM 1968]